MSVGVAREGGESQSPAVASASALADSLEDALRAVSTLERAEKEKAYLKSELTHLGARVPDIRRVVKGFHRREDLGHARIVTLVKELWKRRIHELRMAAVELLVLEGARMTEEDLPLVEDLLRSSRTWALVDPLAAIVGGGLIERNPKLKRTLDRWANDDDFWIRRSAMLALLGPLRAGGGDWDRFTRYADAMLEEKEFFIRKAIGWVLREAGKKSPDRVAKWITPRASRASGVTLREAMKPLSEAQRERILAAR
jgi:3-methyladenine DNA glycosylase AlkD